MDWLINGKTFSEKLLENVTLELSNMATDRLLFNAAGRAITNDPLFSFDQVITILRDGSPFFAGRCGRIPIYGDPKQEGHAYEILGPWDQLERLVFMQRWKSGYWEGDAWIPQWKYKSRCVLGQDETGQSIPVGLIINSVIAYAQECGVAVIPGVLDYGPYIPWDEVIDMSCADVIRRLARWMPDAVGYFDYSKDIPSFNFKSRSSLRPISLTVGTSIESVNLTAVGSRSVPAVVLLYEQSNDVNGETMAFTTQDIYPKGSTGREIGAIVQTIQLPGWSVNNTVQLQSVHCEEIPDFQKDPDKFKEWLLKHHPQWADPANPAFFNHLKYMDVKIDSVIRSSDLQYELTEGTLQDWMRKYVSGPDGKKVKNHDNKYSYEDAADNVITTISYTMLNAEGLGIREVKNEVIATQITSTDCPTGKYRNVSSDVAPGDDVIPGLAEWLFNNLNAKHFRGSVSIAEEEITGVLKLGCRLVIVNGQPDWVDMSAIIQSVRSTIDTGSTTVQVGPPNHLSANDMIALRRANRNRGNCMDASTRISGKLSGNSVDLGSAAPKGFGASSPGDWGAFIDLVSALTVGPDNLTMNVARTRVHVNLIEGTSYDTIDLPEIIKEIIHDDPETISLQVVTDVQFSDNKLQIKTATIKVLEASEVSDWITITEAQPCD